MIGFLAWGLLACSFIGTCLLIWLGVIVLLTAERRYWAIWFVGSTLLTGGACLGFHALLISHGILSGSPLLLGQWPLAWVAGVLQPFGWYVAILWHIGFWSDRVAVRHARLHTLAFSALVIILGSSALLVFTDPGVRADPLALFSKLDPALMLAGPYLGDIPLLAVFYAVLVLVTIGLSLDALHHPAPSHRMMGNLARDRARPWLVAATVALLITSLLICGSIFLYMPDLLGMTASGLPAHTAHAIAWLDLCISLLLLVVIVLIGQAVVAYEIFTGQTLPRRGLQHGWRGAVALSGALGALLALGLVRDIPPIFAMLLVIVLVMTFYAAYVGRAFRAHEEARDALRLVHAGPHVYASLLSGALSPAETSPFRTLCARVLGVERAVLWPLGPLSALVRPLTFPEGITPPATVGELAAQYTSPRTPPIPVDPMHYAGTVWAVPLWGDRGLHGLLLLGAKQDGSLFTQEAMDTARAVAERQLDTLASAELARRLVELQRARMAESRILDARTRRVLHDEVLPQVHAAMLAMSTGTTTPEAVVEELTAIHRQIADLLHAMPATNASPVGARGVLGALRQYLDGELTGVFHALDWSCTLEAEAACATLSPLTAEVLFGAAREAVRNAARHAGGTEDRPVRLAVHAIVDGGLRLIIADDGIGLAYPTPSRGAGHGLTLHSTMMAIVGGTWEITPAHPTGTRVTLWLAVPAPAPESEM